jgi:hypothetical protein
MIADIVQSNFPEGVLLPKCLRVVCDYLDAHGYPLSGCFEICDWGRQDAEGSFPNDPTTQRQVAIFGRGSTGSSYALWLVPNTNPDKAPVVLFGSEGEFIVLASNALEFCQLLGLGYTEVEYDISPHHLPNGLRQRSYGIGYQRDFRSTFQLLEKTSLGLPESSIPAFASGCNNGRQQTCIFKANLSLDQVAIEYSIIRND